MSDSVTGQASISLPVLAFTFILAFCSIVYELLLGQTLSAFLGNTVLRYSVTIGLYMFSMGIGALIAGPFLLRTPIISLQYVEVALAILGTLSVPLLFLIDAAQISPSLLSLVAHLLIIVIGILTGLEIPLLIEVRAEVEHAASRILGVDYIGAFAGTVVFALWFYPVLGIFATAFATALMNAVVGVVLPVYLRAYLGDHAAYSRPLLGVQALILVGVLLALINYKWIEEYGIGLYIGG